MKAILVNGARSLTPGQYGASQYREIPATRPNNVEGWGQVDLANTLYPAAGLTNLYYDVTDPAEAMVTGGKKTYLFNNTGTNPINITLCWSDYPASLAAAKQLVNDLDLTVITPDGVVHYPNALAGADHLNNTEGIDLSAAQGVIQIKVSGYNVPNGPQPYALVIRGAGAAQAPAAGTAVAADFDGDRKADPAVYRASDGWYIWLSAQNYAKGGPFLATTNLGLALAADFDGDGKADPAVYRITDGWTIWFSAQNYAMGGPYLTGMAGYSTLAADFDGDGKADPALYQDTTGNLLIWLSAQNYAMGGPFVPFTAP